MPLIYAGYASSNRADFRCLPPADVSLVTAGYMVRRPAGARMLAKQNIHATLVDAYCLPLDGEKLIEVLRRAAAERSCLKTTTAEDSATVAEPPATAA